MESKGGNLWCSSLGQMSCTRKALGILATFGQWQTSICPMGGDIRQIWIGRGKKKPFGEGSLTTYLLFGSMNYGIFKSPNIRGEMD